MAFGEMLREGRERRGWSLDEAGRRLRIRPDILRTIENSDFENMPPRGYTRNMVNAYAKQVGLNPTEITQRYLDEEDAYRARLASGGSSRDSRYSRDAGYARGSREGASRSGRTSRETGRERTTSERRGSASADRTGSSRTARSSYGTRDDITRSTRSSSRETQRSSDARATRSSRRDAGDLEASPRYVSRSNMEYTNLYTRSLEQGNQSNVLIYVMAVAVVVVIILVVLLFTTCSKSSNSDDDTSTTVPITGLTDTTVTDDSDDEASGDGEDEESDSDETSATTTETVTSVEFVYEVLDGTSAYIEIYLDGSETPSVATTISGYYSASITLTSEMDFKTTSPSNVVAYVDGVEVELEDIYSSGVYHYIFDIDEYNEELASSSDDETEDDSEE